MSLRQFLSAIAERLAPDPLAGKWEAIARLNPEKIYLENVRAALGVSTMSAKLICETAVRRGVLRKRVEVVLPDGSVATSADREDQLPTTVDYWKEDDEDFHRVKLATKDLQKVFFYRTNNDSATIARA